MKSTLQYMGRPDYGLDSPWLVAACLSFSATGASLAAWGFSTAHVWARLVGGALALACSLFVLLALKSSYLGASRVRDHLLDSLTLTGSESALDLGCGRGTMLLSLAQRLPQGRAVGVCVPSYFSYRDPVPRLWTNARLLGVKNVQVLDSPPSPLPLGDEQFDLVTAFLSLRKLPTPLIRRSTLTEALRVLRPGGLLLLADTRNVEEYAEVLHDLGLERITRTPLHMDTTPPIRAVYAYKPPPPTLMSAPLPTSTTV